MNLLIIKLPSPFPLSFNSKLYKYHRKSVSWHEKKIYQLAKKYFEYQLFRIITYMGSVS